MRYMKIVNLTRGTILAERAAVADTSASRGKGLLGSRELADGEGLLIIPCRQVHTLGMKYPIDVIFVGDSWKARRCLEGLKPWRLSPFIIASRAVLELPAGKTRQTGTETDDLLAALPIQ